MEHREAFFDTIPGLGLVILLVMSVVIALIFGVVYLATIHPLLVGIPLLVLFAYGICCLFAGIMLDY
jgi:hypothetical protein